MSDIDLLVDYINDFRKKIKHIEEIEKNELEPFKEEYNKLERQINEIKHKHASEINKLQTKMNYLVTKYECIRTIKELKDDVYDMFDRYQKGKNDQRGILVDKKRFTSFLIDLFMPNRFSDFFYNDLSPSLKYTYNNSGGIGERASVYRYPSPGDKIFKSYEAYKISVNCDIEPENKVKMLERLFDEFF